MAGSARATIRAHTLKKGPSQVDSFTLSAVGLGRPGGVRKEHSIRNEGQEVDLLPMRCHYEKAQHRYHQSCGDGPMPKAP